MHARNQPQFLGGAREFTLGGSKEEQIWGLPQIGLVVYRHAQALVSISEQQNSIDRRPVGSMLKRQPQPRVIQSVRSIRSRFSVRLEWRQLLLGGYVLLHCCCRRGADCEELCRWLVAD